MERQSGARARDGSFVRALAVGQGIFYAASGVWPLLSRRSFEAVTGPKQDWWLVRTVGGLVAVTGAALAASGVRGRVTAEQRAMAAGSAAALAAVDVVYARRGRISRVYLLDAALELTLAGAWGLASALEALSRRRPATVGVPIVAREEPAYQARPSEAAAVAAAFAGLEAETAALGDQAMPPGPLLSEPDAGAVIGIGAQPVAGIVPGPGPGEPAAQSAGEEEIDELDSMDPETGSASGRAAADPGPPAGVLAADTQGRVRRRPGHRSEEAAMTLQRHVLVGRGVYDRDDMKIGEVKGVSDDAEFIIVDRSLGTDLYLPMDEVHEAGGRLRVDRAKSYLDDAPEVQNDRPLTLDDRQRLERFFRTEAA
jgi:hypothetical protein